MTNKLKAVIFSIENVLKDTGSKPDQTVEIGRLLQFLISKSIDVIFFTNRSWSFTAKNGATCALHEHLLGHFPSAKYVSKITHPDMPGKPQAAATKYIRELFGYESHECIYVGASENDMQTAVNGNLLFLRAAWYQGETDYGFEFSTPMDIARFVDTFCVRDHLWCIQINDPKVKYYSLAPFSTYKPEYQMYSQSAKAALKNNIGNPEFWFFALVTSLYFSGIHKEINYITIVPSHKSGSVGNIIGDALNIFGKCFRKKFMPDLVLRHTKAVKSQTAKQLGLVADLKNQLNTIHINKAPVRDSKGSYKSYPAKNKTVLLADDFCTKGDSLAAAKFYLEATGAKVICVTWLKTINTDFEFIDECTDINPFVPNTFSHTPEKSSYSYHANITDHLAPGELNQALKSFLEWEWPAS